MKNTIDRIRNDSVIISKVQGRTGHSSNAMLVVGVFTISHTKCLKRGFWRNFGDLLDFFVWNVAGAFWSVAAAFSSKSAPAMVPCKIVISRVMTFWLELKFKVFFYCLKIILLNKIVVNNISYNFQCFENNKEAEKVEVNYERLKNPKKMFRPGSRTGLIRVRSDPLLTDTRDQLKNRKLIVNFSWSCVSVSKEPDLTLMRPVRLPWPKHFFRVFQSFIIDFNFFSFFVVLKTLKIG
jgi:hypothetical protein